MTRDEVETAWREAPRRRVHLARGSWVVADQAIVSLSSFLAAAIVGRVCGREELGIYGLAVSIFWLVAAIPNSLIWTPYTARAAKLPPKRRAAYMGSVTTHALLAAISIAGALLVMGLIAGSWEAAATWFATMCIALVPFVLFMVLREHVRRIMIANLQTHELLAIDLPFVLLQIGLLLALAHFGLLSANTALLASGAASSVAILWLLKQREQFRFHAASVRNHWAYNQRFGGWVLLVSLAWIVGDTAYRWLVGSLRGMEALGEFTAAQSIVLAINPFLLSIGNLARATAANTLARRGVSEVRRMAFRGTAFMAIGAAFLLSLLALLGGPAVRLIFGPEFGGQTAVVAALCLGMFAHCLLIPIDAALTAMQRGRAMLVAATTRMVMIVAAGAPLIWWRGAEGVGYSIAIGCGAAAIVQWIALARATNSSR